MQLCAEKHCWLSDIADVPADELRLWLAYYELEAEKRKREERRGK